MPDSTLAVRPAYRPYRARVVRSVELTPHLRRVTFESPRFVDFGTAGLDQRIKLLLPGSVPLDLDQDAEDPAEDWYARWRSLDVEARGLLRTYTVRAVRPEEREIDVDFVVHTDAGPAGAWAMAAEPGAELTIVGPDQRSPHHTTGIDWHPGDATRLLLVGDETALPAIAAILESLEPGHRADAFIEVETAADRLAVTTRADASVQYVVRGDDEHGARLIEAVRSWCGAERDMLARAAAPRTQELEDIDVDTELLWESPGEGEGEFYAWIAGESSVIKTLRRELVQGAGVNRKRVAFMGYWRRGVAERNE